MKRALALIAVLLALAATIVFTQRRAGGVGEKFPASRAAELAPAEPDFFVHFPDLDCSMARWQQSELKAIVDEPAWQSPPWQAFLANWWENHSGRHPRLALVLHELSGIDKVAPAGLFLAATNLADTNHEKFVGGFPFRGKRTDIESRLRALKDELFQRWPAAKSELRTHHNIEIEAITPGDLFLAYRDDWLFFSNDRPLLEDTLDRYLRRPDAPKSLADNPIFAECRKHEVPEPDFITWEPSRADRWNAVHDWSELAFFWSSPDNALEALHYSWRLDGPVRERLYTHLTTQPKAAAVKNDSLALTTPGGRAFAVVNLDALHEVREWLAEEFALSKRWKQLGFLLSTKTLALDDLWSTFGPEMTLIFPPRDNGDGPNFVVALDVRDAAKARNFAETIADAENLSTVATDGETTRWDWPAWSEPPNPVFNPGVRTKVASFPAPLVLTKTHLLFGTTRNGVLDVARRGRRETGTLQDHPAYAAAVKGAPTTNAAFIYFDTAAVFSDNWFPLPVPFGLAPEGFPALPRDALAKHLHPGTIAVRPEGPGWLVESSLGVIGNQLVLRILSHEK